MIYLSDSLYFAIRVQLRWISRSDLIHLPFICILLECISKMNSEIGFKNIESGTSVYCLCDLFGNPNHIFFQH